MMFHSISPTSHRSTHSIFDVPVGVHTSAIFGIIRNLLVQSNYCLLENNTIMMYTVVPVRLIWGFFRAQDTSTGLLLPRNPHGLVSVR